jgi:hypothetical protein
MRQTTIWDFLPQESSTEAKPTNQRNIMQFNSLEEVFDYIRRQQDKEPTVESELTDNSETQHDSEECLDCKLAQLEQLDTLLLANVNVAILEVINNTLNQEQPIRNEQADTLLKLTQVRSILLDNN